MGYVQLAAAMGVVLEYQLCSSLLDLLSSHTKLQKMVFTASLLDHQQSALKRRHRDLKQQACL